MYACFQKHEDTQVTTFCGKLETSRELSKHCVPSFKIVSIFRRLFIFLIIMQSFLKFIGLVRDFPPSLSGRIGAVMSPRCPDVSESLILIFQILNV